jgi:hypothetical protein
MNDEAEHRSVPISIDGREFEVEPGRHETAGDLLELAGLNPAGYELAKVLGHGDIRTFQAGQVVDVKAHEKFVSIRQTAPVA